MDRPKLGASWRDSARSSKLWVFDSSAFFPVLVFLFHIEWWTFFVTLLTIVFLSVLSYYGYSAIVFGRIIRSTLAGKRKMATPWWL